MRQHWLQRVLLGLIGLVVHTHSSARNILKIDASTKHPPHTCALPEWLSDFVGPSPKERISFITEARVNSTGTAGALVVLNGNVGDDSPLVLFDCRQSKALVFLHIPKNAGTSIEAIGKMNYKQWGAVRIRGQGFQTRMRMTDGNTCSSWHVPPYLYPGKMYQQSEVFCVVREPAARCVSEFRWQNENVHNNGCNPNTMNMWIQKNVRKVAVQRFHSDCHFVPQTDYVFNPKNGARTCQHVLKMTNLQQDFNQLMVNHGYGLRMWYHKNPSTLCPGLSKAALWASTLSMIHSTYYHDYQLLNMPAPNAGPSSAGKKAPKKAKAHLRGDLNPGFSPRTPQVAPPPPHPKNARQVRLGAQPELCLNVFLRASQVQEGDALGIWGCTGVFNEELVLYQDGTVRIGKQPDYCLSSVLRGAQILDGDELGMYKCTGAWNQRFLSQPDGTVRPVGRPDMCLSIVLQGTKARQGDKTGLYPCQGAEGAWNQRFFAKES